VLLDDQRGVTRPLLAAALIVRDEALGPAACLVSLAGVVDEIHVHDTGSVDGTPELAARFGAVVGRGGWSDDFAAARNAALAGWSATVGAGRAGRPPGIPGPGGPGGRNMGLTVLS
jgi:hypothetical protein